MEWIPPYFQNRPLSLLRTDSYSILSVYQGFLRHCWKETLHRPTFGPPYPHFKTNFTIPIQWPDKEAVVVCCNLYVALTHLYHHPGSSLETEGPPAGSFRSLKSSLSFEPCLTNRHTYASYRRHCIFRTPWDIIIKPHMEQEIDRICYHLAVKSLHTKSDIFFYHSTTHRTKKSMIISCQLLLTTHTRLCSSYKLPLYSTNSYTAF